ncbi:MAG: hypothetical protein EA341_02165 [Mongoliibacter sp.]|uniref:hypothetical protein n=1 Tax=Mongoliibacter sp. TaxID=2022438 RepID=UPI0012EFE661|nr:hypothetical protein [Mongoliibacter sp.]TVP52908.1 MAG: hypothetical protein EA341_02165 [Mongoliibacter sp.]
MIVVLIGFSSCQETGQEEFKAEIKEKLKEQDPIAYENKLKELTLFMGEVFKDPEARRELFEFAEIEGNQNDIEYSMKKLFTENTNPLTRQHSAIVSAFFNKAENLKTTEETAFNEQELIDFINENDIGILAPYLYENFDIESITELTVSWWTQGMEDVGFASDPGWEGETPGIPIKINDSSDFLFLRKNSNNENSINQNVINVNDFYAKENPTIVIGSFDENELMHLNGNDAELPPWDSGEIGNPDPQPSIRYPHEIGVKCDDLLPGDIVRYVMPDFQLTGNTRAWPWHNKITIWSASITSSPNQIVNNKKIVRDDFSIKKNFAPALLTSFSPTNGNVQIGMSYKKNTSSVSKLVNVSEVNEEGEITNTTSVEFEKSFNRLIFTQSWNRCEELDWNYLADFGNGFIGPIAVHEFLIPRSGKEHYVRFTVAPQIVRFN